MLYTNRVIDSSGIQFGTSGARGLVSSFTPEVSAAFTHAFLNTVETNFSFQCVAIAIDNRPSSPEIARACIHAIESKGYQAIYYGVIPTPALAYTAMLKGIPSIMVTGSHIPFNRNGLKFYRPDGEITKLDEKAILGVSLKYPEPLNLPDLNICHDAKIKYIYRYTQLFPEGFLKGKKIGIYEHSSAGRDIYAPLFTQLGAEVISLDRSDKFVPIDTEAVSESDKIRAKNWVKKYQLDCVFSTDGDGDRPLVSDEYGNWLRGDILGFLCAKEMRMEALSVPVSCNSIINESYFDKVVRTRIGSPYVIDEFTRLAESYKRVSGFEANGGYLLGTDIVFNGVHLGALPTRDALLPALILLYAARASGIAELVSRLPKRYTYSDRIKDFPTGKSQDILNDGISNPQLIVGQLGLMKHTVIDVNTKDGLRITLDNDEIIHLRPSGNAPELRCYVEANSEERARMLVDIILNNVQSL